MIKNFDVIIIGAGASGFACAISASKNNKTTAILEHNTIPLKKVAVSGGGRCNFTNLNTSIQNYVSNNNKFCLSALQQFSPHDFLSLIQKHKIKYCEKAPGQLFSASSSQEIMNMLKKEASQTQIFYSTKVQTILRDEHGFTIETTKGTFNAKSLVIATGGASYQNLGASEYGYQIAKQFNLKVIPFRPSLVPFTLDNAVMKDTFKLKGIALDAIVKCNKFSIHDNILFTHFGLSGPAILQTSLYWNKGDKIFINMLPQIDIFEELKKLKNSSKGKKISNILGKYFPERLVSFFVGESDIFITEASNKLLEQIAQKINNWEVIPIGTQGFRLAEVTLGGVDVEEISSKTFEAKKVSGLFFIGEVLDVTGQLGGFNLQWAWSSGFTAGKYA